jgi:phosphoadenosine phosphosulfate reductase
MTNAVLEEKATLKQQLTNFTRLSSEELVELNQQLEGYTAEQRVTWALQNLPAKFMLSSSFGAQSAVMLHMLTQQFPDIPVVLTDTGYLFPETYQFIDELTEKLNLNLKVYSSPISAAWQEAKYGKLWENGSKGIEQYNKMNKVVPMQIALDELEIKTWFAGLRRSQSDSRQNLPVVQQLEHQIKVLPVIDWSNKDLHYYLKNNDLPYHPLWEKGYVSIGDWHTTRSLEEGMSEQDTRFFGGKRECGLHEFGGGI